MPTFDPETLARIVEQAGGWEKLLAQAPPLVYYRSLIELSKSPRAMYAIKQGPGTIEWDNNVYLRGFQGGLEQCEMLLAKALKEAPVKPKPPRHEVTYASHFGPTRKYLVTEEGGWIYYTLEDVYV